jgi:hypothetical protein
MGGQGADDLSGPFGEEIAAHVREPAPRRRPDLGRGALAAVQENQGRKVGGQQAGQLRRGQEVRFPRLAFQADEPSFGRMMHAVAGEIEQVIAVQAQGLLQLGAAGVDDFVHSQSGPAG